MSDRLQSLRPTPRTAHESAPSDEPSTKSSTHRVGRKRGVSQVEPPKSNNQPNSTTSSTNVKKARTAKTNDLDAPGTHTSQPTNPSKRTRPSNNEHPALRPGILTKLHETREEITARTAGRRAEDKAKREARKAEEAEKREREEDGKAKIAAAMNASEQELKDQEEINKVPFGGNVDVPAFNGGFDARSVRKNSANARNVSFFVVCF